ncbi:MAG: carotenoid biosynthesis protein [Gemmatimonadaceae bacterium]|jgi:putative membrane protein|nr:carotenoid biosynthesis protein [Gemmatimonadaceae bacterium]
MIAPLATCLFVVPLADGAVTLLPRLTLVLCAGVFGALLLRGRGETTTALVLCSVLTFACMVSSALHLLGRRATGVFVAVAVTIGWFAEQMGDTRGWFFGRYHYTDVLGPKIGAVPFVIPLMWFALAYIGYVMANLIVRKAPTDEDSTAGEIFMQSLLGAALITAYDLGADPYMVYVVKAWIMVEKDGGWFGETVQGFVGWMTVAMAILLLFRAMVRRVAPVPVTRVTRRDAMLPVLTYAGFMLFQVMLGHPIETRSIAAFAMGIPVLAAVAGWRQWRVAGAAT